MIRSMLPIGAICFASMLVACSREKSTDSEARTEHEVDVQADEMAIREVLDQIVSAFNTGDVESFLANFTDDAIFDPPNGPARSGKEANRSVYLAVFENSTYDVSMELNELVIAGDWAFDRTVFAGTVTNKATGESRDIKNGNIHIYKRQPDGSWKIAWDIWNSDIVPES